MKSFFSICPKHFYFTFHLSHIFRCLELFVDFVKGSLVMLKRSYTVLGEKQIHAKQAC